MPALGDSPFPPLGPAATNWRAGAAQAQQTPQVGPAESPGPPDSPSGAVPTCYWFPVLQFRLPSAAWLSGAGLPEF